MSRQEQLCQWVNTVSTNLTALTKAQAMVVARFSFGMVLSQSCGLTSVATMIAPVLFHLTKRRGSGVRALPRQNPR